MTQQTAPTEGRRTVLASPSATIGAGVLMLAAIGCLAALLVWQSYQSDLAKGEARVVSSAHVVAAHFQWMIQASDQTLRRIDAALGPQAVSPTANSIANLRDAVGDLPSDFQYSVYDAAGNLRLSSMEKAVGVNVSDRDYFLRVRSGESLVISPLIHERLSNLKVFVIARPIRRDGHFAGAATIAIPATRIGEFWSSMGLGAGSTVSVVGMDGWLVARFPPVEESVNLKNAPLFEKLQRSSSGFYSSPASPVDGRSRLIGYWQVEGWPIIATAGLDRGDLLADFREKFISGTAVAVPVLALVIYGLLRIGRLLSADARRRVELEETLEQNRFLLREIHHRVKNNLQTVASLVRLQPLPDEARASISGRIAAMVAVHEQIYQTDKYQSIDIAPYITKLVEEIAAGYDRDVSVDILIAPLSLDRDRALPLGLIVNEVVSNALKHAFPNGRSGRVAIRLDRQDERGEAVLTIADDGVGYDPALSPRNMGSKLIAGFTAQLGGTFSFEAIDGTRFTLTFPLDEALGETINQQRIF